METDRALIDKDDVSPGVKTNQYLKEEREVLANKKLDFASASDIKQDEDKEIIDYNDIDADVDAKPKKHNTEDEKPLDVDNIWFSTEFSYFGDSEEEHEKISR